MGMFTSLIEADKPELFAKDQATHDKLVAEAAVYGSAPIGSGKNKSFRNYRLPCGHEQEVQTGCMRIGQFACRTCQDAKLIDEAALWDSEPIGSGKNAHYRNYRLPCGHEQQIQVGDMRNGEFACRTCQDAKLIDEAAVYGAEPIGRGKNSSYLNYRLPCGHEQQVHTSCMRVGRFRCQTCQDAKLIDEAAIYDSAPIGSGKNKGYLNYRLPCGHEQQVHTSCMRIGQFACQTCEDTWATKPSNVYVHSITLQGETIIKVGIAQNVQHRIKGYGLPSEAIVRTVLVIPTKTGKEARDIESCLVQEFKKHKAKNIGHIMTKSGETECFRAEHLADVMESAREAHLVGADAYEWVESIQWA